MRRREFITLLGGTAVAWPLAGRAQQPSMPVIGFLRSTAAAGSEALVGAFRQGLREAGFVEGQNVAVEYRWADDQKDRISQLAVELVRRQPAVIVANGLAALILKAATAAIPIVFTTGFDPVRTGLVASLNRPGGNATGIVFTQTDLAAKQLGLLHELAPKASTIAGLGDGNEPELEIELREIEAAGRAIGRRILIVKAGDEREFNVLFGTMVQAGAGALLVRGSPLFLTRRRQLVALAARHALLASYPSRDYVEAGGLMRYGPDITDAYRRVGVYVGRILKGEKPADLPVDMATKFNLAINLATAKAIDLDISPILLARADEVIEGGASSSRFSAARPRGRWRRARSRG
jgi:putative ABC transport system substrate-binding protein